MRRRRRLVGTLSVACILGLAVASIWAEDPPPRFPHVSLVVSGGHTALYVVRGPERIRLLAATRDDAASSTAISPRLCRAAAWTTSSQTAQS